MFVEIKTLLASFTKAALLGPKMDYLAEVCISQIKIKKTQLKSK